MKARPAMKAQEALFRLLTMPFRTVLDIGAGPPHADILREQGKSVTTINLHDADVVGDYMAIHDLGRFDCVWASHVLEHQPNPNLFLRKCLSELDEGGILAVTVPPLKHEIVGGHLTLWNAGLLLYHIIVAGCDCADAAVKTYGYNVSVIVNKATIDVPELNMDKGDVERLAPFFPFHVKHGFDGRIDEVNWT